MLIYNAKIYTMTGEPLENGFLCIEDGKIAKIGKMLELTQPPKTGDFNAYGMNGKRSRL